MMIIFQRPSAEHDNLDMERSSAQDCVDARALDMVSELQRTGGHGESFQNVHSLKTNNS